MIQFYFRKKINPTFEEFNFFLLGLSAAEEDALVQVWREKVRHDSIRPTTVIQSWGDEEVVTYAGDPSPGPRPIAAKDFEAFIRVMPHSEFPSGSSCLCSAYVEFTEHYLQRILQDLKRQCGESRLWGGMHFAEAVPA